MLRLCGGIAGHRPERIGVAAMICVLLRSHAGCVYICSAVQRRRPSVSPALMQRSPSSVMIMLINHAC